MGNRLLVKISLLVVACLLACPIGGFLAEHIGSVPTEALFLARMSQYASSIRVVCIILLVYFIYRKRILERCVMHLFCNARK